MAANVFSIKEKKEETWKGFTFRLSQNRTIITG